MFSGIVKIADIDDYINPAQNCVKGLFDDENNKDKEEIKPVEVTLNNKEKRKKKVEKQENKIKATISLDNNTTESLEFLNTNFIKKDCSVKAKDKTVKLSLNDCLACSGCVTTAETMLIEQHSIDEFLNKCNSGEYDIVVSICPQSLASLAYHYEMSIEECFNQLNTLLTKAHVKMVLNYQDGVELCLLKAFYEFEEKIVKGNNKHLICSECPGWICYAEKKVGDWIIPYLSNLKTPQQLIGKIIKNLGQYLVDDKNNKIFNKPIYFCSIMPCFDKKLESSRLENKLINTNTNDNDDKNMSEENSIKEVDNVISSLELEELFSKLNFDFKDNTEKSSIPWFVSTNKLLLNASNLNLKNKECSLALNNVLSKDYPQFFATNKNYSSNGYTQFIIESLIKKYLHSNEKNYTISHKKVKNSDYQELTLKVTEEGLINIKDIPFKELKFALIYGFRNIQKAIRAGKSLIYDYIEIMSCPAGCLNGGAQYKTKNELIPNREMLAEIEKNIEKNLNKSSFILNEDSYSLIEKTYNDEYFLTKFKAINDSFKHLLNW